MRHTSEFNIDLSVCVCKSLKRVAVQAVASLRRSWRCLSDSSCQDANAKLSCRRAGPEGFTLLFCEVATATVTPLHSAHTPQGVHLCRCAWWKWQPKKKKNHITFTFTFRAFGRRFYPKRLTKSTFVEGEAAIYHCGT